LELCCRPCLNNVAMQRYRSLVKDENVNVNCIDKSTGCSPLLLLLCNNIQTKKLPGLINFLFQFKHANVNLKGYNGWSAPLIVCHNFSDRTDIVAILSQLFIHGSNDFGECIQLLRNRKFLLEAERLKKIYSGFLHGGLSRVSH